MSVSLPPLSCVLSFALFSALFPKSAELTPPSDVDVSYVDYAVVNIGQLYNMVNVQDIANLNDGYLIGTTIQLEDDFIKKYVEWFISSGTLPTAVQDLIIS